MKMKYMYALTLFFSVVFVRAQTNYLRINPNVVLPKDTIESRILTTSLNNFLSSAQKPNDENKFVLESQKLETFLLLDEINGIEKSGKFKDDFFFKPYLTNVVPLKKDSYLIQVSYIGTNENVAILRANFEFIAYKNDGLFAFSSPILTNTKNWKVEKVGRNIFHYETTINKPKTKEFSRLVTAFDLKLKSTDKITEFYCTDNLTELEKLIGIDYKLDYNGRSESIFSSILGNRQLIVLGNHNANFNDFDPHDLFHDRLSLVIPRNMVNKPVDEGCAYLYGGSWGLSWKEIFKAFKEQIAINKNTNWLELKEKPIYFNTKAFNNSADYIVNALLIEKIERENGFAGVWELLNIGPFEKGNEKYYQTLEKLTGITKTDYNEKVWELINSEK